MSNSQSFQDAHSTNVLNYGHLGTLSYDQEAETWETLRIINPDLSNSHASAEHGLVTETAFPLRHLSSQLLQFDTSDTIQEGKHSQDDDRTHANISPRYRGSPDALRQQNPRLTRADAPHRSDLLSFGGAVLDADDAEPGQSVILPTGSLVCGRNGQFIRFFTLEEQPDHPVHSVDNENDGSSTSTPPRSHMTQAYWTENASPVQQLCFGTGSDYQSTWMAARLERHTTIFHPLLRRRQSFESESHFSTSQVLTLEANPVLNIPIERTGGHPHRDVDFHPGGRLEVALIDNHGSWSVWKISSRDKDKLQPRCLLSLVSCGTMATSGFMSRPENISVFRDGWHKIRWCKRAANQTPAIFLCNRHAAGFREIRGSGSARVDLRLDHPREGQIILDVQTSHAQPGYLYVLTSLSLLAILVEDSTQDSGKTKLQGQMVLAWRHFRSRNDLSLRLVLLEAKLVSVILLTSFHSDLVLSFRFARDSGSEGRLVSQGDPHRLILPRHARSITSSLIPISCSFQAISKPSDDFDLDETGNSTNWKLFALYDDLSLVGHIYECKETYFSPLSTKQRPLTNLGSTQDVLQDRNRHRHEAGGEFDDFIVGDTRNGLAGVASSLDKEAADSQELNASTRNWEDVYRLVIVGKDHFGDPLRKPFDTDIGTIRNLHRGQKLDRISLLSGVVGPRLLIRDVDDDSKHLELLVSSLVSHGRDVRYLPSSFSLEQEGRGLTSIYDAMLAIHLTPLLSQTPDRVRIYKERLARRVASDLFLASRAIFPQPIQRAVSPTPKEESRPRDSKSTELLLSSQSSSFPFPSSLYSEPSEPEISPLQYLRQYTIVNTPSPASASDDHSIPASEAIKLILRHLPTSADTDPALYDWQTVEDSLAAEKEEEAALEAARKDPRAWRRAEKARQAKIKREEIRRKLEQEAALKRLPPTVIDSSQVPVTQTTALPDRGMGVQSSQLQTQTQATGLNWESQPGWSQGEASTLPFSQSQDPFRTPGRVKEKGKKRAAGF